MRAFTFGLALVAMGCGASGGLKSYGAPEGSYSGKGKFSVSEGSMDVEATLTLNPDKTYQLRLKPLGTLGNEAGTWTLEGTALTLSPNANATSEMGGGQAMAAMSSAKQPKTWTMGSGYSGVTLQDGPMALNLTRTP